MTYVVSFTPDLLGKEAVGDTQTSLTLWKEEISLASAG
jgi:hypothetical protein